MMSAIRWVLGRIILLVDFLTPPKGIKRSPEAQDAVDKQTAQLALYHFHACPFCVKVRRSMKRHSLNIETRDAKRSDVHRDALLAGGGKLKVPCLKITDDQGQESWMYESSDIIQYLEQRFGEPEMASASAK